MPSSVVLSIISLVNRARQGNRSAMNRLMELYRPELLKRAQAGLPRRLVRKLDPEDLVQDCQLEVAAGLRDFRGQSPVEFGAWMRAILDRRILQQERRWRRKKRDPKREEPLDTTGGVLDVPAGSTTSNLGRLAREEGVDQLMMAVGWLRQDEQEVINLRLWEDWSYEEIATRWGVTCDVVRQRFSRAIGRLRRARRLQELMTERRIPPRKQDVIGIHRLQAADATTIADRLQLPDPLLVALWLDEARPVIREFDEEKP